MKRRIWPLLLAAVLLVGCGKKNPNPLVGTWLHGQNAEGFYTFREDGTGQWLTYLKNEHGFEREFTYEEKDDQLILRFADGENKVYVYGVSGDTLVLICGMEDENFTKISGDDTLTWKDLAGEYWWLFFSTMTALYVLHLTMPYSFKHRPAPEDWPDRFFGTFSKGQLVQYVIQVPTLPLVILLSVALHGMAGLSEELCVVLGILLVFLWGLGPMELSRKIDGWK